VDALTPLLCFGEALIDFLQTGESSVDGLMIPEYRQFPGGAPANVAVAFARLGGEARFAGQVGDDTFGNFLESSLNHYGVDTRFLHRHPTANTALAFVSLDSEGDRSFSFYRDRTADLLFLMEQVSDDWFTDRPVFHVCSNTLTNVDIAAVTQHALDRARQAGCMISFDVNLRPGLWPGGEIDRLRCNSVARSASFIKFAKEEIEFLADGDEDRYVDALLAERTRLVVVTNGGEPVEYFTRTHRGTAAIPAVDVVDTTAAGDAFTAAVLRGLCSVSNLDRLVGDAKRVAALIEFAVQCGSLTTTRAGAFPALPKFAEVADAWTDMP
jgi:fructokinase